MRTAGWLLAGGDPASPGPPWTAQDAEITASVAADARILANPLRVITLCLSMPEFRALRGHRHGNWHLVRMPSDTYHALYVLRSRPPPDAPQRDTLHGSPHF